MMIAPSRSRRKSRLPDRWAEGLDVRREKVYNGRHMPTYDLTPRQRQVLGLVERHSRERGYPPTLRELAAGLGLSGTRAVEKHLAALERKGRLTRGEGSRALQLPDRGVGRKVPIIGRVAAGAPLLAQENRIGELTVDAELARGECFLLKVKGQSMRDAGILDGDLVLVRPQRDAETGEVVVALLEGEATVKRLVKKDGRVTLKPENPEFKPLTVRQDESFQLVGKVAAVLRLL